jgi:hypothetical protein
MLEAFYLGLGIIAFFLLNAFYVAWRGSQTRKEQAERNNPFASK